MKVLCVAEKPSIAKSVAQILSGGQFTTRNTQSPYHKNYDFYYAKTGDNYTMTAVSGHLTEKDFGAALRSWTSCDPFQLFDAPIETRVSKDGEKIERNLLSEARGAQLLMIWTDCDREGENIGAEVEAVCLRSNPRMKVKRARFSAIIPAQIHRAAQNPVDLDRAQADAVEARILLDLRYGAAFTRMQTLTLQPRFPQLEEGLISYGPCQFPTLGFVVSRYEQVQAFVPEPFWYIYLSIASPDPEDEEDIVFLWRRHHIFEFDVALALYEGTVENPTARVTNVTKKPTKKWKPLPLTTVELQKAASRLLHMTPKKALDVAEKLYNDGFLSYPRTETDQFDPAFDFDSLIAKQTVDPEWGRFATGLQNGGFQRPRDGKKNDKAHPPIHPTAHAGNLTAEAKKVYEYVTRRFLACCSKDAEGFQTTVDVVVNDEEFYATGLIVLERNYLEVYKYDKWTGKHLPDFQEGQEFMPSVCELKDGETTSPSLLTEADLVTLMDKNGIGTDATIAQHIQTIIDRQYVISRQEGSTKYLVPSTLGIGLIEGYNRIGFDKSLSKPLLRRETERMMVQVCDRQTTKAEMMARSIEQYKEVFIRARQQFNLVIESVGQRINGAPVAGNNNGMNMNGRGGRGGAGGGRGAGGRGRGGRGGRGNGQVNRQPPDDNQGSDSDGDGGGGRGGGRRGHGSRARGRAATSPIARRGRGGRSIAQLEDDSAPQPTRRAASPAQPMENEPRQGVVCQCGEPAGERTVTKDGPNKGRKFFTCGKDRTCDFFEWFDGPSKPSEGGFSGSIQKPRSTIPAKRKSADYVPPDDSRRCNCKLTAVQRTVQKEGPNKGRTFWTCPNSEKARCGFFEWDDNAATGTDGGSLPGPARTQPRNDDQGRCFKCDQPGHWSNACPNSDANPRRQARNEGSTGGDTSGVCFKVPKALQGEGGAGAGERQQSLGHPQPGEVGVGEGEGEGGQRVDSGLQMITETIPNLLTVNAYPPIFSAMGKALTPFRAVSQRKRFVLAAATISTIGLLFLSPLPLTPTARHITLRLLPQASPELHPFPFPSDLPAHQHVEGGRLKTTIGGRHPLYDLIMEAETTWDNIVKRQSTTLSAAVKSYRRRYGRRPPKGFEKWYEFARSVNFKLIDEFDQIDRDITPFLALPHHIMQQRLELASKDDHSYHFTIKDGNFTIGGPLAHWDIAAELGKLIQPFAKDLPDMKFYVSGHDGGPSILPEDMRIAVSKVLKAGKRLTEEEIMHLENLERNPRRGVANACLEDPVTFYPSALPEQNQHTHTFVTDHRRSMSFCANPTILNNPVKRHGYFAYDVPHQRSASPLFVQSQPEAGGALLHPALQSYMSAEKYHARFGSIVPWQNRSEKVFWRGRTTGEYFNKEHDWRFSHRIRIHTLSTPGGNRTDPNVTPEVEVLVEDDPDGGVQLRSYSRDFLNEKYMDVSLIGGAVQCDDSDTGRTCQTMDESLIWGKETGWEAGLGNKFLLDIDGNGWSSRFQRLLTSGAVVLKMTIFPEWNSDWLIPYYHYVPIQVDYSDLYDLLAFFIGTPDGIPGHDHLAEKIGAQANRFTVEQWRPEDMQVYIYRLLLEYARMVTENTDTMSMA